MYAPVRGARIVLADDDGAVEIYVAGKEGVLSLDALGHAP